ncbi:hypothetical protein NEA10_20650 (plasmid) [Phormidium yuhuli AB48]|jgi:hypothetical protein|uniref:Uncharacterized protein n=1 Tax=Phormidium yuhuli AB48 TaxID=2940671 RepID=A0ABY5AWI9_9CYAN|nr:hypothetical protein [Phormidium yuhuli]USR93256.1 hypothetical protein NEA10_20650 [Phormidium yuhuli AB48]
MSIDTISVFERISKAFDELDYYTFLARTGKPDTPQSLDEFCRLREAFSVLLSNDESTFNRILED